VRRRRDRVHPAEDNDKCLPCIQGIGTYPV